LEPFSRTVTSPSVPLATFTTTPRSGRTLSAPSRGVIVNRGAGGTSAEGASADAGAVPLASPCAACPTIVPEAVSSNADPTSAATLQARLISFTPVLNRTLDLQQAAPSRERMLTPKGKQGGRPARIATNPRSRQIVHHR
jgi:hypothetical protein